MRVGSLFSGIGGLDLGLERAGMQVKWQCEIDPYCRKVLAKHWPDVPCYEDVRNLPDDIEPVDLLCGGYPCQPFSIAGGRQGTDDPRHLWPAFGRTLRLLRPEWALLENVPGHLSLGFDGVLADLAEMGYDTEWTCIPAAAVGAPHLRWRLFVVAHANEQGQPGQPVHAFAGPRIVVPDTLGGGVRRVGGGDAGAEGAGEGQGPQRQRVRADAEPIRQNVADTEIFAEWPGLREGQSDIVGRGRPGSGPQGLGTEHELREGGCEIEASWDRWWSTEPNVGRVAHGVPARVDRLRALGNAVVPQVAELIGRMILDAA